MASSRQLVDVIGADIKGHEVVIFDFSGTTYLDDIAAKLIGELLDIAREQRTEFVVVGLSDAVAQTLFAFGVLQRVPEECLVESMEQARGVARGLLEKEKGGRTVRSGSIPLGRRSGAKFCASSSDDAGTMGSPVELDVPGAKRRFGGRNARLPTGTCAGEQSAPIPGADSA